MDLLSFTATPFHLYNGYSRFYRAKGQEHTAQAIQNSLCTGFWRVISWLIFLHVNVKFRKLYVPHSSFRQRASVCFSRVKLLNRTVRDGTKNNIEQMHNIAQTDIHLHWNGIWLKYSDFKPMTFNKQRTHTQTHTTFPSMKGMNRLVRLLWHRKIASKRVGFFFLKEIKTSNQ